MWKKLFILAAIIALTAGIVTLAAPSPVQALRAVFLADTQGGASSDYSGIGVHELTAAMRTVLAMKPTPDMVFCLGDLVGRGYSEDTGYQFERWKELMRPITQAGIPLYVMKGNHELTRARKFWGYFSPAWFFLRNQEEYAKAFKHMPANGPAGYEHLAYTVTDEASSTVFVTLDSQFLERDMTRNPYGISQAQLDWLRAPLPAVDKAVHRIVLAHVPAFNPLKKRPDFKDASFQHLWEIMEDKGFDLMIAAHVHTSSFALIDKTIYPASRRPIVQVVTGPVGGRLPPKIMVRSDPAVWNTFVGSNFLLLEIDGPRAEDPIRLTVYGKTEANAYTPIEVRTVYSYRKEGR